MVLISLFAQTSPLRATAWMLLRWSVMAAIVFWVLVCTYVPEGSGLPQFVYVNF